MKTTFSHYIVAGSWLGKSFGLLALVTAMLAGTAASAADMPAKVTYDDHIKPIFRNHCLACHDQDGRSGGLALDTYGDSLAGGASGEVLSAGAPDDSRLYKLTAHIEKPIMPPGEDKIPDEEIALLKAWIDGGLLENSSSKAKKRKASAVAEFTPSADNRPEGDPAMPSGLWREPVVHADRPGVVVAMAASPWAPLVAIGGQRQVMLYHADSQELLGIVPFVVGTPQVVRFSRNGDLLLIAGGRAASLGVADLWDIKKGKRLARLGDELDAVLAADVSPDHSLVAIGGPRKRVKVLRTADGTLAYDLTKHTDWVTALEFSPNGKFLITADRAGNAHVWEGPTGRAVGTLTAHKESITSVSWRGDSGVVATGSDDGSIRIWTPGGQSTKNWGAHGGGVQSVSYTKDGRLLTAGRDRQAKLWDGNGKQLAKLADAPDVMTAVAPLHDGGRALAGDFTGQVKLVDLADPKKVVALDANPPTLQMRIEQLQSQVKEFPPQVEQATAALAGTEAELKKAQEAVAAFEAKLKTAKDEFSAAGNEVKSKQADAGRKNSDLAAADRAIQSSLASKQTAEAKVKELEGKVAAEQAKQGENVDKKPLEQFTAELAKARESLASADYLAKTAAAGRKPIEQALAAANKAVAEAQKMSEEKKKAVAAVESERGKLPPVKELVAKRDAAKVALATKQAELAGLNKRLESVVAEHTAYHSAEGLLADQLKERQSEIDQLSATLTSLNEKHESQMDGGKKLADDLKKLEEQLDKLRQQHRQTLAEARKTQDQADEVGSKLDTAILGANQTQGAIDDLKAAKALQTMHTQDD